MQMKLLQPPPAPAKDIKPEFSFNRIFTGDATQILSAVPDACVDLSFWSPPYFVGKSYERDWSLDDWKALLRQVILQHARVIKPGGFMAVNIGDILCFADETMPRFQANNVRRKKSPVTREQIIALQSRHPGARRRELADMLGCSEQTIQRRLENNNVRGGKQAASTRVLLTGAMLEQWSLEAGLYLYDQRIWHKDPCWANCRWHSNSYRAVDEFEHLYIFWRPGITEYDRERLSDQEWSEWGVSRRLADTFRIAQRSTRSRIPRRVGESCHSAAVARSRRRLGSLPRRWHDDICRPKAGMALARHRNQPALRRFGAKAYP